MWANDHQSLPDWIEDGYEILVAGVEESGGELSHDQARDVLLAHDAFPDEPHDAEYVVDRLLDSGWLYEADGSLRITDPDW